MLVLPPVALLTFLHPRTHKRRRPWLRPRTVQSSPTLKGEREAGLGPGGRNTLVPPPPPCSLPRGGLISKWHQHYTVVANLPLQRG